MEKLAPERNGATPSIVEENVWASKDVAE